MVNLQHQWHVFLNILMSLVDELFIYHNTSCRINKQYLHLEKNTTSPLIINVSSCFYGANIALCKLKPMKKRTIWCLAQLFDTRGCKKDKNSTVWIWKMTGYLYIYHVFYCYVFPVYLPLIHLKCYNKATHISARLKKVFPF